VANRLLVFYASFRDVTGRARFWIVLHGTIMKNVRDLRSLRGGEGLNDRKANYAAMRRRRK